MSEIGTPMTSGTVPAVGTTGTSYATLINAFLTEVKQRLEDRIPLSSLLVSLLDMANNAIENVASLMLYSQSVAPTEPVGSLQNYLGDLYWVSPSGAAQLTTGNSLNAAGLGGITGDYGGLNPAQLRFDDGDETYTFYDDFAGGDLAEARAVGFQVANVGDTAAVTVDFGGTSSYALTLPASLPGSQALVQMEADGDMVFSNTLSSNQSITLQGTGTVKHGEVTYSHAPTTSWSQSGTYSYTVITGALVGSVQSGGAVGSIPLQGLKAGDRLKSVKVTCSPSGGSNDPTLALFLQTGDSGSAVTTTGTGTPSSDGFRTLTVDTPTALDTGSAYYVNIASGLHTILVFNIAITYDRV